MKFHLKYSLPFILKENLVDGYVEEHNGVYRLTTSDGFRQNLKASEYSALLEAVQALSDNNDSEVSIPSEVEKIKDVEVSKDELRKGKGTRRA